MPRSTIWKSWWWNCTASTKQAARHDPASARLWPMTWRSYMAMWQARWCVAASPRSLRKLGTGFVRCRSYLVRFSPKVVAAARASMPACFDHAVSSLVQEPNNLRISLVYDWRIADEGAAVVVGRHVEITGDVLTEQPDVPTPAHALIMETVSCLDGLQAAKAAIRPHTPTFGPCPTDCLGLDPLSKVS